MIDDDDFEIEDSEDFDTDFIIDPINEEKSSICYGLYSKLLNLQNYYNQIQNSNKKVAATWLIASFIGMGYVFSKKASHLPLDPLILLIIIAFGTICGITLLWFLDIYVYQTYFYAIILENLKFEKKYEWFPKVNKHIGVLESDSKKQLNQSNFYMGCNFILMLIITFALLFFVKFSFIYSPIIVVSFVVLVFFIRKTMIHIEHPNNEYAFIKKQYRKELKSKKKNNKK